MPGSAQRRATRAAAIQPLATSMMITQIANAAPCVRSALVAPALPLPELADVDAAAQPADHEAADNRAEKIGEQDLEQEFHGAMQISGQENFREHTSDAAAPVALNDVDRHRQHRVHATTYRRTYLRVASAWRAVSDITRMCEVAEIFVPAAHFEHVAGEGAHLGVVDGDHLAPRGAQPRRSTRPRSAGAMSSSATTAMRVPTYMSTLVW